ncbi:hypothetical protein AB0J80_23735 [Actinoplanes sp. NPDC049548]|uniref:hypothetical protein n=1 Tax=Actinoplanes sp. NPDC049548 TaxID=3155152 RepID=UPI00342A7A3B
MRMPDPARKDAVTVLAGEWQAGDKGAAAEAVISAWREKPWPDGLLALSLFVDADGDRVLHYSQWTVDDPPLDLPGASAYRLYRGGRTAEGRTPGAIVIVRVDTDGPDIARTWVDAVFDALDADAGLPSGGIGGFFHVSTDGTKVLNYAEWESAEAHREALAANNGGVASGPLWTKVRSMPGVHPRSVTRYHLYATLSR